MRALRNLGGNLLRAACLVLMLPTRRLPPFRATLDQLVTLVLLDFVVEIACERLEIRGHVRFWRYGLGYLSTGCVATFLAGYVAVCLQRKPSTFIALAVALFGADIVMNIIMSLITIGVAWAPDHFALPAGWSIAPMIAAIAWTLVIFGRAVMLIQKPPKWRLIYLLPLMLAVAILPVFLVGKVPLWYADERSEAAALPRINVENTYARQSRLLNEATLNIKRHQAGATSLYFVSFAGWGDQDVFLKEARFSRALFDRRFGTDGRSLVLANNPATIRELPLASVANLNTVLARLAARMDVEDDLLFLFLTSHGSPGDFGVRLGDLQLNDLPAATLPKLLDDAHIKWRVIVISACYSGSFIDALKDEHSLIMTAAAADRTSFGCGTEEEFTYFGDAYFNQALQHMSSFVDAFTEARAIVGRREAAEKLKPSDPQIFIGDEIERKLKDLGAVQTPEVGDHSAPVADQKPVGP